MAQALYLKYRPQTFEQVEGQEHVTRTLRNALATNRISHAYLFTGPRGTGKTSTARILAKAVNCLNDTVERPCNECAICRAINEERLLDLIEIDAASNTGVDDIRELRDKVDFRPGEARFKVYIIDEAHMLSNAAFNALLKTLEEPPPHVIFVLATTEPNKVPATITSRCQRFDFRRATLQELIDRLAFIAEKEELQVEPRAVELIARQATGSFRDAASLLDQLMAYGGMGDGSVVTLAQVQGLLGASSAETIHGVMAAIAAGDVAGGINRIGQAVDAGADPRQLAREVVDYARGVLLFQVGGGEALTLTAETQAEMSALTTQLSTDRILRTIRLFNQAGAELRASASPTLPLEMALVEAVLEPAAAPAPAPHKEAVHRPAPTAAHPPPAAPEKKKAPASSESHLKEESKSAPPEPRRVSGPQEEPASEPPHAVPEGDVTLERVQQEWPDILKRLHKVNKMVHALLLDAQPVSVKDNLITIGFFYPVHKDKVDNNKSAKPQLEKILAEVLGRPFHFKCVLSPKKQKMKDAEQDPLIREGIRLGGKITDVS
ncbi:MAG: DNA polymerase III subunit gamma/tau [Rudaea sp.]